MEKKKRWEMKTKTREVDIRNEKRRGGKTDRRVKGEETYIKKMHHDIDVECCFFLPSFLV